MSVGAKGQQGGAGNSGSGDGGASSNNSDPLFGGDGGSNSGGSNGGGGAGSGSGDGGNSGGGAAANGGKGASSVVIPDNWKEVLPQEMRDAPALKNISTIDGLVKSLLSAQSMVGADKVVIPGKHATADDWKGVFKKLGLPEKAEDFKVDVDAKFKDDIDGDFMAKFVKASHDAGVMPFQAKQLAEWFAKENKEVFTAQQNAYEQAVMDRLSDLKKEWGGKYDSNIKSAQKAMTEIYTKEEIAEIRKSGLGKNALFIRGLAKFGESIAEDSGEGDGLGHESANRNKQWSPKDAKEEIGRIRGDLKGPYYDPMHPEHAETKKKVKELYGFAFPEQKGA